MSGTVIDLCSAVRERVSETLASIRLETENPEAEIRTPRVINGYLPPKRRNTEPESPFVIVRPSSGDLSFSAGQPMNKATLQIIICTYSEEFDAHELCLIVADRIIKNMCESPTLDNKYTLEYPLRWELFDDQPAPFWQLVIDIDFILASPIRAQYNEVII